VPRAVSLLLAVAFGVASAACSAGGAPCAGPTCGTGYECLANRCALAGGVPVPRDSERLVLSPIELAVATADHEPSTPEVTLGSAHGGDSFVYARFGSSYKGRAGVAAAFLLLTVSPGTEPTDDVPLEVWTLAADWSANSIARGARPGFSRPMARGIARTSPALPVRVDVTSIVQQFAQSPGDQGIAVVAGGSHGRGVTLVTAAAGAPRLEVYLARN